MILTESHLIQFGASKDNASKYVNHLNTAMQKYGINTPERVCHFLSQSGEESGMLCKTKESLMYSAKRMMEVWPKRFPNIASTTGCVMNTEGLAAKVYEGRKDLGNNQIGDGKRFLGRGLIQLTGRDLYTRCGKSLGVDLINHPELLEQPEYATLSAAWYWSIRGVNPLADISGLPQVKVVTLKVNGGETNLKQRQDLYIKAKQVLGV
jgi:putative chitinase